jgi:hypothetical protein
MNKEYAEKVEVLLRLLPIVMDEKVLAVQINLQLQQFKTSIDKRLS